MPPKKTKTIYNPVIHCISKKIAGFIAIPKQNVKFHCPPELRKLKPPYIVVSNHVGLWDPFLLNHPFRYGIRYIISDAAFRNKVKGWYLKKLGGIPKTKGIRDSETVRGMLQTFKENGVVGIFPEGDRSYDGTTMPLNETTGKMLKKLQIPVISAVHKGTSFTHPRWSKKPNRGRIEYHYRLLFTSAQLAELSAEEVQECLQTALNHDDTRWQQHALVSFQGGHRAEFIGHPIFLCPGCNAIGMITSSKDNFSCAACKNTWHINEHGFFEPATPADRCCFDNLRDWLIWQKKALHQKLSGTASGAPLFSDDSCSLLCGHKSEPLQQLAEGTVHMMRSGLEFHGGDGARYSFSARELRGLTVQENEIAEFYHGEHCYRLLFQKPVSGYKWITALQTAQQLQDDYSS